MSEPMYLGLVKTRMQNQVDRLATFLTTKPSTAFQATRREAYLQQLQEAVSNQHQWATEMANHFTAVKDLLDQQQKPAEINATAKLNSSGRPRNSRKSGATG